MNSTKPREHSKSSKMNRDAALTYRMGYVTGIATVWMCIYLTDWIRSPILDALLVAGVSLAVFVIAGRVAGMGGCADA
jgi:hypothetical protein